MQNVLIVGAGEGGSVLLNLLIHHESMNVIAIVDTNNEAPGIRRAQELGIPYGTDWRSFLTDDVHIIFDVTGDESIFPQLIEARQDHSVIIPGSVANLLVQLLQENNTYIKRIRGEMHKQQMVFDSIEEGMIGISSNGQIDFINKSASKMTGIRIEDAVGRPINEVIPMSNLLAVYESGKAEMNRELVLGNGLKIVTSRYPLFNNTGDKVGAFAVFKDISEVVALAEEVTGLNEMKTMLEAIIHSSDDAISVVDEHGNGILINPAYTRITGLTEEEIIGKPASEDIIEGESIHMKVLQTKKPIRGVSMRIGENSRDVIVNVAPIIVDQEVKGSVGVIHDITEMRSLMNELAEARTIIRKLEETYTFDDIYGSSHELEISVELAKLAAKSSLPVLLRGEVGTGKELFAHAIHSGSERKPNKFIRVNCSAIHSSRLEAEIFGQEELSGLGKWEVTKGLIGEAENGTLFLDEVAELPLLIQQKLATFVTEGAVTRKGGTEPVQYDVRIITASSRNLEKAMQQGELLEELYYPLNRIAIHVPPLRTRKSDIPEIAGRVLEKLNRELGMNIGEITEEAMKHLQQHDWPGNVRELENVLSRAMIYMEPGESVIGLGNVVKSLSSRGNKELESTLLETNTLASIMEDYEKTILDTALKENGGNKSLTANRLGISLRSLYYKLEKYDLI
ncbi:transcriptional regulator [Bacillus sp. OxB-1]|uniref:sigma-54-dependent Fis family transcriptional regulator n=1 Tax=Bacillus sp. (strain OxB-1) TaxID=98228 RepID=UPI0005823A1F|nr:sigma-54-dependent Fis family transcriptional regulator [Bacillus sp. OxB-1]BAQ11205.1 transcriptional regulator [Bacillus sp. OxB-1]